MLNELTRAFSSGLAMQTSHFFIGIYPKIVVKAVRGLKPPVFLFSEIQE